MNFSPVIPRWAVQNPFWGSEGESYEFNFFKFWTLTCTEFNSRETETQIIWHIEQETPLHHMVTDFTCEKKGMMLIGYEAPDGAKRHNRLWNGGTGVIVQMEEYNLVKNAMDQIPQANANAKCIVGLVKAGSRIKGYLLSDETFVSKPEAVSMAKQGQIAGVGIAHRGDTEHLKAIPNGSENNNLGNLPSVSPEQKM